jgi:hypothetical protein
LGFGSSFDFFGFGVGFFFDDGLADLFNFLDDVDWAGSSAILGFGSSGKCASHFGGLVGARTATEYSQILFVISSDSLYSNEPLHSASELQKRGRAGKALTF